MFVKITLDEGREIVKQEGVQLAPNLKIVDAIAFDSIMKNMRLKRSHLKGLEDMTSDTYYRKYLGVLATWNLNTSRSGRGDEIDIGVRGNIIIQRVKDAKLSDSTIIL